MSIYQEIILDHYHNPENFGNLKHPNKTIDLSNPLCGDTLHMEINKRNNQIYEIGFTGQGCAISMASASLLTEHAKGKPIEELKKLSSADIISLLGIELSPNRLKCALLPLEALKKLVL